jgi:hypothetical protein
MANKTSKKSTKVAKPAHLAGGNPQVAKADGDGPPVLRFEAQLFQHPKTAKTDFQTLLNVPEWVSKQFPSRGMTKVEGTINGHPFRAALEPNTSGSHWLRVNKAMLKGAGAHAGDTVRLAILGPNLNRQSPPISGSPLPLLTRRRRCGTTSRPWVVATGSGGSNRPSNLRPEPAGSHGPSNSFPQESGALVV